MNNSKVTIKELAEIMKVSPSTISRALQNHPSIGKKTTAKIHRLAKKMGYYPNSVASNLRRNKTNLIGVIIPRIDRHFHSLAIAGIEEVAYKAGYYVTIFQSNNKYEREKDNARMLLSSRADGVIACLAQETDNYEHFEMFKTNNIPLVFFDRVCYDIESHKVIINDYEAAIKATEHLVSVGCRRIAHIAGSQEITIFRERLKGYREAVERNKLYTARNLIFYTEDLNEAEGRSATEEILKMRPRPDGIFCANDRSAISAIQTIKKAGLKVPEDIAVVGFSNTPASLIIEPQLTSIDDHAFEMGQAAARLLIRQIEDANINIVSETITIQNDLIIRQSTGGGSSSKN